MTKKETHKKTNQDAADNDILLKDRLFNAKKVHHLASEIHAVYPAFNPKLFEKHVVDAFESLELKARISWITDCLKRHLPANYRDAIAVILNALPPENNPDLSDNDFGDFIYAPYANYVAQFGCTHDNLDISLNALKHITARFSAEDAIRYFINAFPQKTMATLMEWCCDSHYHVRRLCSEGTRPKLPWAKKITLPIDAGIPLLDSLFSDKTRFVTRSVANHMNDISKLDPKLAVETLSRWRNSGKQKPNEMRYIIRHALRSLIKQGNPDALTLLGIPTNPNVAITQFQASEKVNMNTALETSFTLTAKEDTHIIADYSIAFQTKAGTLGRPKVFKWTTFSIKKNESAVYKKQHLLRENMTTRTLYKGKHVITLLINGTPLGERVFWVL